MFGYVYIETDLLSCLFPQTSIFMFTTNMRTTQYLKYFQCHSRRNSRRNPTMCLNSQDAVSYRSVLFIRSELQDRKMSSTYSVQPGTNVWTVMQRETPFFPWKKWLFHTRSQTTPSNDLRGEQCAKLFKPGWRWSSNDDNSELTMARDIIIKENQSSVGSILELLQVR